MALHKLYSCLFILLASTLMSAQNPTVDSKAKWIVDKLLAQPEYRLANETLFFQVNNYIPGYIVKYSVQKIERLTDTMIKLTYGESKMKAEDMIVYIDFRDLTSFQMGTGYINIFSRKIWVSNLDSEIIMKSEFYIYLDFKKEENLKQQINDNLKELVANQPKKL